MLDHHCCSCSIVVTAIIAARLTVITIVAVRFRVVICRAHELTCTCAESNSWEGHGGPGVQVEVMYLACLHFESNHPLINNASRDIVGSSGWEVEIQWNLCKLPVCDQYCATSAERNYVQTPLPLVDDRGVCISATPINLYCSTVVTAAVHSFKFMFGHLRG